MNRKAMKRSLASETKAFITNNIKALEAFLEPTMDACLIELETLEGPRGRVLERSFKEARTAWEKFFWSSLGRHWIQSDLALEEAVRRSEQDLMELSQVLETVVALEALASRDPSITRPLFIEVESDYIEDEELMTLEPTEEMEDGPPMLTGAVPEESMMRCSGPEDTTVVERFRGRPKL